jgi:hypothetical protein
VRWVWGSGFKEGGVLLGSFFFGFFGGSWGICGGGASDLPLFVFYSLGLSALIPSLLPS